MLIPKFICLIILVIIFLEKDAFLAKQVCDIWYANCPKYYYIKINIWRLSPLIRSQIQFNILSLIKKGFSILSVTRDKVYIVLRLIYIVFQDSSSFFFIPAAFFEMLTVYRKKKLISTNYDLKNKLNNFYFYIILNLNRT